MFQSYPLQVPSTDMTHTLRGIVYVPNGEIKAMVQFVHGMQEHIGRYDPIMSFLAEKGFLCFGHDHLGHGRTAGAPEELGFMASKDGWKLLVDDVDAFAEEVRTRYPGHRLILLGHSMGSFVARLAAAKFGSKLTGLILSGTGGPNPLASAGLAAAGAIRTLRGSHHVSKLLDKLAFSHYNDRFPENDQYAWLTRDPAIRSAYAADPLCGAGFTVAAMQDLMQLCRQSNLPSCYAATPSDLPVFLIAGTQDPVGDYGAGVQHVCESYRQQGMAHVSIRLYENCRHEVFNELDRCAVFADVLNFLYTVIP